MISRLLVHLSSLQGVIGQMRSRTASNRRNEQPGHVTIADGATEACPLFLQSIDAVCMDSLGSANDTNVESDHESK